MYLRIIYRFLMTESLILILFLTILNQEIHEKVFFPSTKALLLIDQLLVLFHTILICNYYFFQKIRYIFLIYYFYMFLIKTFLV